MKRTLLLNVNENKIEILDVKGELEEYYEKIGCTCIDITMRKIGGKLFDIVCDDEGLLKQSKISAIDDLGRPMLVGNLMFFHSDGWGELTGLTDGDIRHLLNHIKHLSTRKYPEGYKILTQCEYD